MKSLHFGQMVMTRLLLDFYQSGEFHKVEQILIDAGLNENQIRMSFELKLQLRNYKNAFMECNFLEKSRKNL
jgi:hypothetical protein